MHFALHSSFIRGNPLLIFNRSGKLQAIPPNTTQVCSANSQFGMHRYIFKLYATCYIVIFPMNSTSDFWWNSVLDVHIASKN